MSKRSREVIADWLIVVGALGLFASLFLPWSHQFSAAFLARFGTSPLLQGVPRDPTAWQVYTAVDVLLALLAVGLIAVALAGSRTARIAVVLAAAIALAFAIHAAGHPPTNGATLFDPTLSPPAYLSSSPRTGSGETVAIAALGIAVAGLALSFTAD